MPRVTQDRDIGDILQKLEQELENHRELSPAIERLDERTLQLIRYVAEIKQQYVTKDEFKPIRALVYGAVGIILTAVLFTFGTVWLTLFQL